jgi:hypothetical protein
VNGFPVVDATIPVRIWWDATGNVAGTPWRVLGRDGVTRMCRRVECSGPLKLVSRNDLPDPPEFEAAPQAWIETWGSVTVDGDISATAFAAQQKEAARIKRWATAEARKLDKERASKVEAGRARRAARK